MLIKIILIIIMSLFINNSSHSEKIKARRMTEEELRQEAKYLESLSSDDINKIQIDMKKVNKFDIFEIESLINFSTDDYLGKWKDAAKRNYDSEINKTEDNKYYINWDDNMFNGICDIVEQRRNELILSCVGNFIPGSGIKDVKEFVAINIFYSTEGRISISVLFTPSLECAKKHDFMSDKCYFKNLRYLEETGKFGTVYSTTEYYKVIED